MTRIHRAATMLLDWLWPWCPSGLPHRVKMGVVTNEYGGRYCWHDDCIQASFREVAEPPLCGGGAEHDRWRLRWPQRWPCPRCAAIRDNAHLSRDHIIVGGEG